VAPVAPKMAPDYPPSMSIWTHLSGHLSGVAVDLSDTTVPAGSEGPEYSGIHPAGREFPGTWFISGNLRDRDEDDAPGIRDWFAALCERAQPTEAELEIDVDAGGRYTFRWTDGALVLDVPPLYREALAH